MGIRRNKVTTTVSKKVGLKANGKLKKGYKFVKGGRVVKSKGRK